ncbi:hypothetical protein C2W62_22095, partial [Candidatus Entotheonella serta]
ITTDKFRTLRHINPALMFAKMIKMITRTRPERGAAIIPAHHPTPSTSKPRATLAANVQLSLPERVKEQC